MNTETMTSTEIINTTDTIQVAKELNTLLADYHLYYQKLRNFHWNVKGHNFFTLHNEFEVMYNDSKVKIDEIAERILTLKFHPISNYSEYLESASVEESPSLLNDTEMVNELIKDNNIILFQMRKIVKLANETQDEGTIDMLGGYIASLEKNTWKLDAFVY